jgi:hypothetical protein
VRATYRDPTKPPRSTAQRAMRYLAMATDNGYTRLPDNHDHLRVAPAMTAPPPPGFDELIAALGGLSSKLASRDGNALRESVQQLAAALAQAASSPELRARAATELEKLVDSVSRLGAAQAGPDAQPGRGMDLTRVAAGLRTFVDYLRAPTGATRAPVDQLVAHLQRAASQATTAATDPPRIDATIEALAVEAARRNGHEGDEQRDAVERMKREMSSLVQQLERRAQQEASRARTAAEFERLFDAMVRTGTPLAQAAALERAPIIQAFRTVDLVHMAEGLRVFAEWLSTPGDDPTAHVADLRARLTDALGPPTDSDPARSDAERRADAEREIRAAVATIFGPRPAP